MKRCAGGPGLIFLSVRLATKRTLANGVPSLTGATRTPRPSFSSAATHSARLRKCRLFRKRPRPASAMRSHHFVTWNGKPAAASASRTSNTPSGSSERAAFSSTGSWSPAPR